MLNLSAWSVVTFEQPGRQWPIAVMPHERSAYIYFSFVFRYFGCNVMRLVVGMAVWHYMLCGASGVCKKYSDNTITNITCSDWSFFKLPQVCLYIFLCEYMIQSHAIFPLAVTCRGCAPRTTWHGRLYECWWQHQPAGAIAHRCPTRICSFFFSFSFCLAWVSPYEIL